MCPIADTGEDITIILKIMLLGYNKKKQIIFLMTSVMASYVFRV